MLALSSAVEFDGGPAEHAGFGGREVRAASLLAVYRKLVQQKSVAAVVPWNQGARRPGGW